MPLCCVDRSAVFKPGNAGRRDAAGDALQTDGLVENHRTFSRPGGTNGWRNWGDEEDRVILLKTLSTKFGKKGHQKKAESFIYPKWERPCSLHLKHKLHLLQL